MRDEAITVAKRASTTFLTCLGAAALALAVAVAPADAKKVKPDTKPAEETIADPANGEPMILVVSLGHQKVDVYRGTTLVTSSQVSTGMPGHATKAGVFSILEKQRFHHSNMYSGAPMPWMNRITWSGTALHAGVVPGYPASHGCIRLPFSFAPKLFQITTVGDNVIVTRERIAPKLIEHPNLFQPLPPPAPPAMVKQEQPPERQTNNETDPALQLTPALPVIFAKADASGVILDRMPAVEALAEESHQHAAMMDPVVTGSLGHSAAESDQPKNGDHASGSSPAVDTSAGAVEDTHSHAIDPGVGSTASAGEHATSEDAAASTKDQEHAVSDDDAPSGGAAPTSAASLDPTPVEMPAVAAPPAAPAIATPEVAVGTPPVAPAMATPPAEAEIVTPPAAVAVGTPPVAPAMATPPAEAEVVTPPAAVAVASPPAAPAMAAPPAEAEVVTPPVAVAVATPPAAPATVTAPAPVAAPVPVASPATPPAAATVEASAEPAPNAIPSVAETKIDGGTKAAATFAAEPRSTAPLRILVTRRTQRDRIVGVQHILADLGYLPAQDFDGTLGKASVVAIKAFQKANGMPETGAFTDAFVKKVYEVSGKGEPPVGQLWVRQDFGRVFEAPVTFRDPERPLGTHIFTAMKFAPGDTTTKWVALSLHGDDPMAVLDRLKIPNDVRQKISERLTPGSSLIIGDTAINTAGLPKGADFLVWANDAPAKITAASADSRAVDQPAKKKKYRSAKRSNNYNYSYSYPRSYQQRSYHGYPNWPW
jgi:peptidoglycan hydrolase-like protein with peptidoglycan-binding domain